MSNLLDKKWKPEGLTIPELTQYNLCRGNNHLSINYRTRINQQIRIIRFLNTNLFISEKANTVLQNKNTVQNLLEFIISKQNEN